MTAAAGVPRQNPVGRGVRLGDLDRALVYRIGYVGRRWEVIGPEDAPGAPGAAGRIAGGRTASEARTAPAGRPVDRPRPAAAVGPGRSHPDPRPSPGPPGSL